MIHLLSGSLKSEDGYSSKQTVFRRDSETTRYAAPHGWVYGVSAWTMPLPQRHNPLLHLHNVNSVPTKQGQVLRCALIANLFAANDKNLSRNKNHLWAGESYCPEVILPA